MHTPKVATNHKTYISATINYIFFVIYYNGLISAENRSQSCLLCKTILPMEVMITNYYKFPFKKKKILMTYFLNIELAVVLCSEAWAVS